MMIQMLMLRIFSCFTNQKNGGSNSAVSSGSSYNSSGTSVTGTYGTLTMVPMDHIPMLLIKQLLMH